MSSIKHHVTGIEYWRSLGHLADSPEVRELVDKEFPGYDADTIATTSRRGFLKFAGASMALAGLTLGGCRRWPKEKLAPFASNLRDRLPGVPEQFATSYEMGGVASGLLVTSFDGRPIKIEGSPTHPSSWTIKGKMGAAGTFAQASVLDLYDPQRNRGVIKRGEEKASTWEAFNTAITQHLAEQAGDDGKVLVILSEAGAGPSLADMRRRLMDANPTARWYEYEPISADAELEGSRLAFGKSLRPILHLDKAQSVLLLDADVLHSHPAHVRYSADWAERRRSADRGGKDAEMSRVFMVESTFSPTGAVSDVRLGVTPDRVYAVARAIAGKVGVAGVEGETNLSGAEEAFAAAAAADLGRAKGGAAVVAAGPTAPREVHALAHALNLALGAVGTSVTYVDDPAGDRPTHTNAILDLTGQMFARHVHTLVILGGNPVFDAPSDQGFNQCLSRVPFTVHLSDYHNETSRLCTWSLPKAHYLESWGDARSWDGTAGIVQPLIEPLFGGKSSIELLAILAGDKVKADDEPAAPAEKGAAPTTKPATERAQHERYIKGYDIVRRTWAQPALIGEQGNADLEFRRALEAGFLSATAAKTVTPKLSTSLHLPPVQTAPEGQTGFQLRFDADPRVHDGRFANNGWLQETPDGMAKLVWDNALMISKRDADALGIATNDVVRVEVPLLSSNSAEPSEEHPFVEIAAYVLPGQPVGVVGLTLGYGRTSAGPIGDGLGVNTFTIRTSAAPYVVAGVKLSKTGKTNKLGLTQEHHIIDSQGAAARDERVGPKNGSGLVLHETTFEEYKADPKSARGGRRTLGLQMFSPPHEFGTPHKWGMAIDTATCTGCGACAVACQAENNIPVVGKDQVFKHREMNWIRIDRYFKGAADDPDPEVIFQPMMCQHCENAPCEQVCPVGATMHDTEGLNTMVYNRCIGTRYCSNNCPYKVRRFNYFDYHAQDPRATWGTPWPGIPDQQQLELVDTVKRMVYNPEVTVRMRGVMEKCTYCVQRMHLAVIGKRNNGGDVADGDIMTACEQACSTQAIVFGNLNDPDSRVSKLQRNPRAYPVLDEELNTRPRTWYLAKLRNPVAAGEGKEHPAEKGEKADAGRAPGAVAAALGSLA